MADRLHENKPGTEEKTAENEAETEGLATSSSQPFFDGGRSGTKGIITRLANSDKASRIRLITHLQQSHGNLYVQRVIADVAAIQRSPDQDTDGGPSQSDGPSTSSSTKNYSSIDDGDPNACYDPNQQSKQAQDVGTMNTPDKLIAAGHLALPKLAPEMVERVEELLSPEAIKLMLGFTSVYIASQLTPAGWVSDLIAGGLVLVSVLLIGPEVVEIIKHIVSFIQIASGAKSESDLEEASTHFAIAVTKVGVDVLMAILTRRAGKSAKSFLKNSFNETTTVEMLSNTGEVVKMTVDQIPDNATAMKSKTSTGRNTSTTEKIPGRILSEYSIGGKVIIESIVGDAPGRLGLEKTLPSNVKLSSKGWQKAHSQGNITGAESGKGIRYAPEEVNQEYQRLGIESFIANLNSQKAPGVTLYLKTVTETHPMSLRLKSITYKLEATRPGQTARTSLLETEISITNDTYQPKIKIEGETYNGSFADRIEPFLKPLPNKR